MTIAKSGLIVAGAAALLAAIGGTAAGGGSAHDLSVKLKVKDAKTLGPLAMVTVKNRGTSAENGVQVRIGTDDPGAPPLWTETADLLPGKSAKFRVRVFPPEDAATLVLDADPAGAADEAPWDNTARAAMRATGKWGVALVGRSLHLRQCASCHGTDGAGLGGAPSLLGVSSKEVFARAHAGGDANHDLPRLSRADAKALSLFLKDPAGVASPPPPPAPPPGGWPSYEADMAPLLERSCKPCHFGSGVEAGVRLDNYGAAAGWAGKSLAAVKRGSMPQDRKRFTAEEIATFENWILGGKRP